MKKLIWKKVIVKAVLIISSFVFITLIFAPQKANAVSAGMISAVPANPRSDNPRTASIFVYTAKPGDTIRDEVLLSSIASEATRVQLYSTDSISSNTGTPSCEQQVDAKDIVGKWTNIDNGLPTIPAQSSVKVPFSIIIPKDVKNGEYNGCMVLQTVESSTSDNPGINLKTRLALRIVILIPGDIYKNLEITRVSPIIENSRYIIRPELENKSNVSLDTDIDVDMKAFGLFDYYSNNLKTSFLRETKGFSIFDFKYSEWGGLYRVEIKAKYDGNPANELSGKNPEFITKSSTIWLFMWPDFFHLTILCALFAISLIIIDRYFYQKIQQSKRK